MANEQDQILTEFTNLEYECTVEPFEEEDEDD